MVQSSSPLPADATREGITTVIPTFRRPQLLRRALESVRAQTWPHVEIVVTDNASGDETRAVVEDFARGDPRVRYFEQPRNRGANANFRFGWQQVRTRWMSFLSDDDVLLPGFYAHALDTLARHATARFFCGQAVNYNARDGTHGLHPGKDWTSRVYRAGEAADLMVRRLFTWTASVFDTALCRELGDFPDDIFVDLVFLGRAAARHPFVVSLRPCAVFRTWDEGFSTCEAPQDAQRRFAASLRDLREDPEVSREAYEAMRRHLEGQPAALLGRRLRRAFEGGAWEEFDAAARALEALDPGGRERRVLRAVGRRRASWPRLVGALQRLLRWRRARRKRARHVEGRMAFEDLVARYAPVLLPEGGAVAPQAARR